jgi:hypothetical protein
MVRRSVAGVGKSQQLIEEFTVIPPQDPVADEKKQRLLLVQNARESYANILKSQK